MDITFEELLAFNTVINTGSITAAAQQLEQTTSGVSRAIGRLEKKLNTTLLRRTTRRIELTQEGKLFLKHSQQIINAVYYQNGKLARRISCFLDFLTKEIEAKRLL